MLHSPRVFSSCRLRLTRYCCCLNEYISSLRCYVNISFVIFNRLCCFGFGTPFSLCQIRKHCDFIKCKLKYNASYVIRSHWFSITNEIFTCDPHPVPYENLIDYLLHYSVVVVISCLSCLVNIMELLQAVLIQTVLYVKTYFTLTLLLGKLFQYFNQIIFSCHLNHSNYCFTKSRLSIFHYFYLIYSSYCVIDVPLGLSFPIYIYIS